MLLDRNNTKIRFTCQRFECTEFRFIDKDRALVFDFRSRLKTEDVIEMHYLVGQGSEFYITLTEEVNNLPFIIDWNDAVNLTKLTTFEQAKWYYERMLSIANSQQKEFLLRLSYSYVHISI